MSSPPVIAQQPLASETLLAGATLNASVSALGNPPLVYSWFYDNDANPISISTSPTLTLTNLQAANAGSYSVVVTNAYGSVTSSVAPLQFASPARPTIVPGTIGMTNGHFRFQITSAASAILEIQASTNLTYWETIRVLTNSSGLAWFTDPSTNLARRFYRLKQSASPTPARPTLGITWSNGLPQLAITGDVGRNYAVEYVASLTSSNNWQSIATNALTANPPIFIDTTVSGAARRFYRVRQVS